MFMSVFTVTELEFVALWGRHLSEVFSTYLTESKDVPLVSLHPVC